MSNQLLNSIFAGLVVAIIVQHLLPLAANAVTKPPVDPGDGAPRDPSAGNVFQSLQ